MKKITDSYKAPNFNAVAEETDSAFSSDQGSDDGDEKEKEKEKSIKEGE